MLLHKDIVNDGILHLFSSNSQPKKKKMNGYMYVKFYTKRH